VLARSFDRTAAIDLIHAGVDYQIRETFESALLLGDQALLKLGDEQATADEVVAEVRRRDAERLDLELCGGIYAGRSLIHGNVPLSSRGAEPQSSPVTEEKT
jgi:glutathione-regulated potassium-efflux system protein KefB